MQDKHPESNSSQQEESSTSQNRSKIDRYTEVFLELEDINEQFRADIQDLEKAHMQVRVAARKGTWLGSKVHAVLLDSQNIWPRITITVYRFRIPL